MTLILELINPKANQTQLKKPPILLFHGANIDMTSYLSSSSIQHHPEKYPRTAADGPITSSNRSIGFSLVNYGFRVFLIGSRGSNRHNQGHLKDAQGRNRVADNANFQGKNLTQGEIDYIYERNPYYWLFSQDDEIALDTKNQIDKVRNLTGTKEYFLFAFSLTTPITLAFFTQNPDYARDCKAYMQMGPAIAASHVTDQFDYLYFEQLCPQFNSSGIGFFPTYTTQPQVRSLITFLDNSMFLRYTLVEAITNTIFGPSPIFNTNLELNTIAHVLEPTAFKMTQQYCQNSVAKKLQKFDYKSDNMRHYNQSTPPKYGTYMEVQNWGILTGTGDGLADLATVDRLVNTVSSPKPVEVFYAPYYNHLDMFAGTESDIYIVFQIIRFFNRFLS